MEIRQEITQIVNSLPSNVLENVLAFVKKIEQEKVKQNKAKTHLNLEKILLEDEEVLKKLAK